MPPQTTRARLRGEFIRQGAGEAPRLHRRLGAPQAQRPGPAHGAVQGPVPLRRRAGRQRSSSRCERPPRNLPGPRASRTGGRAPLVYPGRAVLRQDGPRPPREAPSSRAPPAVPTAPSSARGGPGRARAGRPRGVRRALQRRREPVQRCRGAACPRWPAGSAPSPTVKIPGRPRRRPCRRRCCTRAPAPPSRRASWSASTTWARSGSPAKVFDSSFTAGRQPAAFPIGTGQVIAGFDKGIVGKKLGSRVLLVIPPAHGYGSKGNPNAGITGDDTLVFVVDLLGARPATPARPARRPAGGAPGCRPSAPARASRRSPAPVGPARRPSSSDTVVTGTGDTIRKGDLVVVQYVGVKWADGKQFDSSWDRGAPAGFGDRRRPGDRGLGQGPGRAARSATVSCSSCRPRTATVPRVRRRPASPAPTPWSSPSTSSRLPLTDRLGEHA